MILLEYFRENEITLSKKGVSAMGKAIRNLYPNMDMWYPHEDDEMVRRIISFELPDEDCLKILQLTAKYAGLWAFA
jgi:hypothetical protein